MIWEAFLKYIYFVNLSSVVLDPTKCNKLSMDEKRELVYEISKWSHGASEMLQSWSRQELLQILCAEMGKERKYTGLTKVKIVENLLKIISEKKSVEHDTRVVEQQSPSMTAQKTSKRQRKPNHPLEQPASTSNLSISYSDGDFVGGIYCKNSACKAILNVGDAFCKRCSCCICHKFDDNKDPSLWLTCSSEPPFLGHSCNMSCHLECFLKHEVSSIARAEHGAEVDGIFHCVSCGKANDLISCCRKQLMITKDTRRVDILCYRLSLSQKLLAGTKFCQNVSKIVDEAVKKLEAEVGPLTGLPVKMARGIVNRLSSGQEVQRLCNLALEALDYVLSDTTLHKFTDSIVQDCKVAAPNLIRFEDTRATCVTVVLGPDKPLLGNNVGYTLWHHKADEEKGLTEPTCTLFAPETSYFVSGLIPATEYVFKVVSFDGDKELSTCEVRLTTSSSRDENVTAKDSPVERSQSPATNCSTLSNPSSLEDETCNITPCSGSNENRTESYYDYYKNGKKFDSTNLSNRLYGQNKNPNLASNEDHPMTKICSNDQSDALKLEGKQVSEGQSGEATSIDDGPNSPLWLVPYTSSEMGLPITPCRLETLEAPGRSRQAKSITRELESGYEKGEDSQVRSLPKKRSRESMDEECNRNDASTADFEKYVKVIRWLECKGHIDKSFRQKFLTWYSMRATPQEQRVVKVFVENLSDDLASLAEQLIDTFEDVVSSKRTTVVPTGLCMKLWH
ncbi:hypothetical protein Ancab_027775 [Ancistrocladus abbreviatus]